MSNSSVIVSGTKEVEAAFNGLAEKIQNKLIRKGMVAAGRIVQHRAKELVPVVTGALKRSIIARKPPGTKRGELRRQVKAGNDQVPYARLIERGNEIYAAQRGVSVRKSTPFLKPALEQKTSEIIQAISDSVVEGMRNV